MPPKSASSSRPPNPYETLPARAFWRSGVAEPGLFGLRDLWRSKWQLPADARFATFGSCFAQHISRALVARQMNWLNAEPAPGRCPPALAEQFNYGVFSARTGNIYTAAQLLTLVRMAAGKTDPDTLEIWADGDRFRDSFRPVIEPVGFADADDLRLSRRSTVRAFRRTITEPEVFIFTLGLTEGWENAASGQCYPMCPGTSAGAFDPAAHVFRNYTYPEIRAALDEAFNLMWGMNPGLRILLTVSPVPLTATASGDHVLSATTYSKSALRAVAGDLAGSDPRIDYFPSYEIISGAPTRAAFFEPNLRSVAKEGVDFVMTHFFAGLDTSAPPVRATEDALQQRETRMAAEMEAEELVCEEMVLERFNAS
jgi:hypothetical protein